MPPYRVLAATLAAFFVSGCATRTDPNSNQPPAPKATVAAGPKEKPAQPSPTAAADTAKASPPPPQTSPAPTETVTLPAQDQDHAKDQSPAPPPPPPDPYEGVSAEWRPYYEQFEEILEPYVKEGVKKALNPKLNEHELRAIAVVRLGAYKVSFNQEAETKLRALLTRVNDKEIAAYAYLDAVDSFLAGPQKGRMLASAYEQLIDEGADIPVDIRQKLAELVRSKEPPAQLFDRERNNIAQEAEELRTKLLEQSVYGSDLFALAVPTYRLGSAVIDRLGFCRTFHALLVALPEPRRTNILLQLAWSPKQEEEVDEVRGKLMQVNLSRRPSTTFMLPDERARHEDDYARQNEEFVADLRQKFLALEQARRDSIEGRFTNVEASGYTALVDLDSLVAELQDVLGHTVSDLGYRLQPLVPPYFPRDKPPNALAKIPLPGSVEDRIPTIEVRDDYIHFDAPLGKPSYAEVIKPGNVLVGTVFLKRPYYEGGQVSYHAELSIRAFEKEKPRDWRSSKIEKPSVEGELVLEVPDGHRESFPFAGTVGSGFDFAIPWGKGYIASENEAVFTGSLDKGGPLIGKVSYDYTQVGTFSLTLKK